MNKFGTSRQLAFAFAILMVLCTFLPWSRMIVQNEPSSYSFILQYGPAVPGIYFIIGLASLSISLLAGFFIFYWEKGALIAGTINLIIACIHIFELSRISMFTLSANFLPSPEVNVAPYPAEPVIGVYLLAITSLLFIIQVLHCMNEEYYGLDKS